VRGLAKASPEQTTTTTVTTTITNRTETIICGIGCAVWYLAPHVIKWYPNNTGMAPISLAIALAQPSSVSGASADLSIVISVTSKQVKQFSINGLMIAGAAFEAAMKDAEVGDLFQAISQLSPALGATFTFTTEGGVTESNTTEATTLPPDHDDIGQLYMVGQVALVNWTEYFTVSDSVRHASELVPRPPADGV